MLGQNLIRSSFVLGSAWAALGAGAMADVVINEIMFHPGHVLPEPEEVALEWIELHNTDPGAAVDVSGWVFDNGVELAFPAGSEIAAGGYLIACADAAAFAAAYPEVAAPSVGGWAGRLSNDGERLTLRDTGGGEVDSLRYSDEGEWSRKVRDESGPGWHWEALAGGCGHSLERRNPSARGDTGQNWGASTSAGGTPGAANSLSAADLPPFITDVRHHPAVPKAGEPVTITARLDDDSGLPPSAELRVQRSRDAPLR